MYRFYVAGFIGLVVQFAGMKSSFACKSDADCKGERICEAERCVAPKAAAAACRQDTDCRGNDICEQSVCVAPAPQAPTFRLPPAARPLCQEHRRCRQDRRSLRSSNGRYAVLMLSSSL